MKEIESLLPHRAPFLFVDEIISATKEEIIGIKVFDEEDQNLKAGFPAYDFVPAAMLIESMAQCGGAGVRMLGIVNGLFGLANIESAIFMEVVNLGSEVKYVIKNLRLSEKIIKQTGIAYVNGVPVTEATWMCVRFSAC